MRLEVVPVSCLIPLKVDRLILASHQSELHRLSSSRVRDLLIEPLAAMLAVVSLGLKRDDPVALREIERGVLAPGAFQGPRSGR